MLDRTSLSTVRPQDESVQSPVSPEVVQDGHVGVHVVDVVRVRRVLVVVPLLRRRNISVEKGVLRLGLVVHRVEADDVPVKEKQGLLELASVTKTLLIGTQL